MQYKLALPRTSFSVGKRSGCRAAPVRISGLPACRARCCCWGWGRRGADAAPHRSVRRVVGLIYFDKQHTLMMRSHKNNNK